MKEHIWTAATKKSDVTKSAVKVYESLYKRCGVNPYFCTREKISTKKLFVRKFSAAEVEDVNWAVFIIYAKTSFSLDPLTSKIAIYRDSLTSTIFKWKERYALLELDITDLFFWLEFHTVTFHFMYFDTV